MYDGNAILKLAGIMGESIVDGPGIRFAVFCQGCPHHCEGCHNPETHSFEGGTPVRVDRLLQEIDKDPILKGVTFSGGEPLCQAAAFLELAKGVKERGLDIVIFTGYRLEELQAYIEGKVPDGKMTDDGTPEHNITDKVKMLDRDALSQLLELTDILIDGPFVLAERDLTLQFRGSRNQRVIDMNKTREQGTISLVC
jgi:anaerobic ribonucleoside-triphosphate reductase activating protein